MSFGAPIWFWALAILPLLVLLYLRGERRSAVLLREFISPRLLPELAGNIDRQRRALRFGLTLLALALAITALARPRLGYTYEDVRRRGIDLLIAVDTSRSMLSNDVTPNRLERVKLAAQDLISDLTGDRVGLIAFAGRAFLQAPLTIDYDAAVESINDLDTQTIPEGGTDISEAIALAVSTFGKSAMGNRALVIFTDGEELSGDAVKEAKKAADAGVKIFTVGVGTPQGSLIPIENGFVKDPNGQVVKSKLDEKRLREIAAETGGMYFHLENGSQTMHQLSRDGLAKMQAGEIDARLSRRPIERYEWPLAAAVLALIASLFINDRKRVKQLHLAPVRTNGSPEVALNSARRQPSSTLGVAAVLLLVSTASVFGSNGLDLFKQGRYGDALAQFQHDLEHNLNPADKNKMVFDSGAAAYMMGDYEKALEAFSQSLTDSSPQLQEKSHYNLGRTLEDRADLQQTNEEALQDLENAKSHYEQALKLDPHDNNAARRLEIVKQKIEQLKKHPKQPPPKPQSQQQQQKKKDQNDQQNQDQQQQQQNSQEQAKNNQQNKDKQNQQQQNSKGGKDQQQNQESQQRQQQGSNEKQPNQQKASPSPTAGDSESQQQKNDQRGGESPTPSPGSQGASPSPSPGQNGERPSPSPSNESGAGQGSSPSATPANSPSKPMSGEIKEASKPNADQQKQEAEAETDAAKPGEMSPQQAARLLHSMKDEEARVQLDERKPVPQVYKDW
ncbi:MAG: VWA domain-containing protein [Verrucomicrobia bacterium]|nr:VWA domain-containing protein [Verrucomicrobiota bacterium]